MKSYLYILLLILYPYKSKGQDDFMAKIDSLNKLLSQSTHDTSRYVILDQLGQLWQLKDLSTSTQYVQEALKLAQKINRQDLAIGNMFQLAFNYMLSNEAQKSIDILHQLIQILPQKEQLYATAVGFIGLNYRNLKEYDNALLYMRQAVTVNDSLKEAGKPYEGRGYLGGPMNLAEIFEKTNHLDSALYYAKMSYQRLTTSPLPWGGEVFKWEVPWVYGQIESRLNKDKHAAELYFISLKEAKLQDDNVGIESVKMSLANYYAKMNQADSAIVYATHAFESARRTPTLQVVSEAGFLLKKLYAEQKDYAKALYFSNLANDAKDSLFNVEKLRQVQALTLKEERRQQAAEMQQMASINLIKQWALVLGLLFIVSFALFLYRNNRQKQKLNEQLTLQKTEIEDLNSGLEQKVEERTVELSMALNEVKAAFNNGQTTERKRVSADLHDEIGSALSSIAIFSDLTKHKAQKSAPELVPELDRIGVKSRIMIQTMRDTIWSLSEDNQQSVWERMYGFSSEILAAKGIALVWQMPDENILPTINFTTKRNLFLAFKEAIHNIVKHAEATQVIVELSSIEKAYTLKITDNGRGFDPNKATKDGHGLHNFEERMKEIGGKATFDSQLGEATNLTLQFPNETHAI